MRVACSALDDYFVSRSDPGNRDAGGVNLSASIVNNFIVGEHGANDEITGGSGNDLLFGGTGDNEVTAVWVTIFGSAAWARATTICSMAARISTP